VVQRGMGIRISVSVRSDSMAEGSEFELPVPVSKLSDESIMLRICDGQTNCPNRAESPMRSAPLSLQFPFALRRDASLPSWPRQRPH
jgi:hypothetical protein